MSQTARIAKYSSPEMEHPTTHIRPFESLSQSKLAHSVLDLESQKFAHFTPPTHFGATEHKEYPETTSNTSQNPLGHEPLMTPVDEDIALGEAFAKELSGLQ